jgi:cellulose synthase/poly-beta-1,6-N-acetylglucosamine synthase-like glycosyltransferase
MRDLDLPIGKRSLKYRFFEILPALISYGALALLVILSLVDPNLAAIYLMVVIITLLVKSFIIAYHTIRGHNRLVAAQKTDWHGRLAELEDPGSSYARGSTSNAKGFNLQQHLANLQAINSYPGSYPKPSQLIHGVVIAAYNEAYDVIQPTIESVKKTTSENNRILIFLAYEERGGAGIEETAIRLQAEYKNDFLDFQIVKHPKDMPGEVMGKGPNITYAGYRLKEYCERKRINQSNVIVTTLDCDNKPHPAYFDYVAYEYITHENRKKLSYQPIALYFGNIWDAPAPMRVIATGNSFWTIISSMRPHTLRNFAAHSQPLDALVEMDFWSTRSIVEDGHQYWRSYFYFGGDYDVVPIHVPVFQDAVMADTLKKTFITQFKQLRRWGYGVSDIPYVAVRLFTKKRNVPFAEGFARFVRLVDSHVTLAVVAVMVALGGWVPLLINPQSSHSIAAHQLPEVISVIQRVAMVGLFITILLMLKMLPPRPERYKRRRTLWMVLQWVLMPLTSVGFSSLASLSAQTHLATGKYLDKFDVTEKATLKSREAAKAQKRAQKNKNIK